MSVYLVDRNLPGITIERGDGEEHQLAKEQQQRRPIITAALPGPPQWQSASLLLGKQSSGFADGGAAEMARRAAVRCRKYDAGMASFYCRCFDGGEPITSASDCPARPTRVCGTYWNNRFRISVSPS